MTYNEFISHLISADLTPTAKLLMFVLLSHRNRHTGECYPSYSTLAAECSLSIRSIQNAKGELEEAGFMEIQHKKQGRYGPKCNHYIINIGAIAPDATTRAIAGAIEAAIAPDSTKPIKPIKPKNNPPTPLIEDDSFDRFWEAYPRHIAKQHARKAWAAAMKHAEPDKIIAAAKTFATSHGATDEKYIPHPATWLNGKRWEDIKPVSAPNLSEKQWSNIIDDWASFGRWPKGIGGEPFSGNCLVPEEILKKRGIMAA